MNEETYNDATESLYGPPSLIKGEGLQDARKIAEAAYQHGYSDCLRINRAGRLIENDPFLDALRKAVERKRKKLVRSGTVEPTNEEEAGWVR